MPVCHSPSLLTTASHAHGRLTAPSGIAREFITCEIASADMPRSIIARLRELSTFKAETFCTSRRDDRCHQEDQQAYRRDRYDDDGRDLLRVQSFRWQQFKHDGLSQAMSHALGRQKTH